MGVSVMGVVWYKPEHYDALLGMFPDRDKLHSTFEEWLKDAVRVTDQLRRNGIAFRKVFIDPDTFPAWCAARGLSLDAGARARFATEFVRGKAPHK